jgi:hypothetical protein
MSLGRLRARLDRLERSHRAANPHIDSDFPIDPAMAKQLRDDQDRLDATARKQACPNEYGGPPSAVELAEAERLKASIKERARAIECPLSYGPIRARADSERRHHLWCKRLSPPSCGGFPLNAIEDAEEAQVRARLLVYEERPEERKQSPAEAAEEEYLRQNHPWLEVRKESRRVLEEHEMTRRGRQSRKHADGDVKESPSMKLATREPPRT